MSLPGDRKAVKINRKEYDDLFALVKKQWQEPAQQH